MNPKLAQGIKITSIIFITCAIALEIFNLYLYLHDRTLPSNFIPFFWLGTIMIIAHAIEGVIAATKVNRSDRALASRYNGSETRNALARNPISYGIYTFFVGFVGLQEISDDKN